MTFTVALDAPACQGYANCLIEAPEIWDFDEDNDIAVLKNAQPDAGLLGKAEASARGCPANVITIERHA